MHSNELNVWAGSGESNGHARAQFDRGPLSQVDPNKFNDWTKPEDKKTGRVERALDKELAKMEVQTCPKCGFKTRSKDTFLSHTRENSAGLISCELERQKFAAADSAQAQTKLLNEMREMMKAGFSEMARAITESLAGRSPAAATEPKRKRGRPPKNKKGIESVHAPRIVRGESQASGSESTGSVESKDLPVADS